MKALVGSGSTKQGNSTDRIPSIDEQKHAFSLAASKYFAILSSLDVRLRRQIYALEEAQVLPADVPAEDQSTKGHDTRDVSMSGGITSAPTSKQRSEGKGRICGGGLGNLDVGWLNSRNDRVGKGMEAEIWGSLPSPTTMINSQSVPCATLVVLGIFVILWCTLYMSNLDISPFKVLNTNLKVNRKELKGLSNGLSVVRFRTNHETNSIISSFTRCD